jgi:ferredoxin-NADP reductase
MAGTALLGRLTWQLAELVEVVAETPRVKTIVFDVPGWHGHRAGQHVDVRLTARTAIRRSEATRSPRRPTALASRSPSRGSRTARSPPT